jgi:hypothetical protein
MKVVILSIEEAKKRWPDKQNLFHHQNPSSSLEERTYKTVEDKHLPLFRDIHSIFSKDEREFFRCKCNHLIIEHNLNGSCNRPNCECTTLKGKAKLPISRRKIVDWKVIEEKCKSLKGAYNANPV